MVPGTSYDDEKKPLSGFVSTPTNNEEKAIYISESALFISSADPTKLPAMVLA